MRRSFLRFGALQAGAELRILTTTYTGSTEQRALDQLRDLGGEVRVSYDTSSTRLHAKAWLFYRSSGFSTAYIGSSNLTHSAQVVGLEWNVRVSGARNAGVSTVSAVFESYWNNADFRPYDREEFLERTKAEPSGALHTFIPATELRPEPFQERLLEQLVLSRQQGHHRNLLAAATGRTGKTVVTAALDYAALRENLPRSRLLFVAHREDSTRVLQPSGRRCRIGRSASCGSGGDDHACSITCLRRFRVLMPRAGSPRARSLRRGDR